MAELLVTGGAGFIGSNFVHDWRKTHPDDGIVVLDALTYAANPANLEGVDHIELILGDIRDTDRVGRLLIDRGIDTIVHFAAESHVDRSIDGPDSFIETNILGTHNLLKAAKAAWLDRGSGRPHRFHHISTDEVYGSLGPDDAPASETAPYAPNSPYSASKAGSDHLVRAYHRTFGLETTASHCSNNYGRFQFPEKLIPLFLVHSLIGKTLPIYGDGMNVRDWLHVGDHCRALGLVLDKGIPGETYNIGGGEPRPNVEVVDAICLAVDRAFSSDPELRRRFPAAPAAQGVASASLKIHVPDRPGHDRRYAIDDRKIREELGYVPSCDFADGLHETVSWYLANETWWRAVIDGRYRRAFKQAAAWR